MQQVKFRLHLCGTPLCKVADSAAVFKLLYPGRYDRYPAFYRKDLRLIASADNSLELIAEHLAVSFQIIDILHSAVPVFLQILIDLDTVLGKEPRLGIQLIELSDVLPHKV